jgi:hypothetical protein
LFVVRVEEEHEAIAALLDAHDCLVASEASQIWRREGMVLKDKILLKSSELEGELNLSQWCQKLRDREVE